MVAQLAGVNDDDYVFEDESGLKTTKSGGADTFQEIAWRLGLNTAHQNGARAFTGHSARVTGAIGIWQCHKSSCDASNYLVDGCSRVFLHYIQDTPLSQ